MKELKCVWCVRSVPLSDIKPGRYKNEHGTVIERRCPHCGKVLAAYTEEDKQFLSKIRVF